MGHQLEVDKEGFSWLPDCELSGFPCSLLTRTIALGITGETGTNL